MSIFKCKMCGGSLEIVAGTTVVECQYCGTKQTLPRLSDERISNLYDRANHFRRNNDYDKALSIYEQILSEDRSDSEAYWSIVLCRYGIEYVEDPATHRRIPTINRAQYTSIFSDEDYKSAILYADDTQKAIYEQEAEQIDSIQKGILEVSQSEDPFDVFICYKETDANGRRTQDSVLATELYNELTREGYKVFFSRVTLEDKLGQEYEPIIFAALNSAKVMVVLGTKPEHFNAVWVKNEWSRYLSLIRNGARNTLIPAYKDMDPYDLPEEFSHLQAQDMSKLGFLQDLTHGIKKILSAGKPTDKKENTASGGTSIEATIDYALLLIEDGNVQKANQLLEQVVATAPKHPMIYVAKLLIECGVKRQEDLALLDDSFDHSPNYEKAVRFASPQLKVELESYAKSASANDIKAAYDLAVKTMNHATTVEDFDIAEKMFNAVLEYADAQQLSDLCAAKAEDAKKEAIYKKACILMETKTGNRIESLQMASYKFDYIKDYKDSAVQLDNCERLIYAEKERIDKKKKRNRNIAIITVASLLLIAIGSWVCFGVIIPKNNYNKAEQLFADADYSAAHELYNSLVDYEDSAEKAKECLYIQGVNLRNEKKWDEANEFFVQIKDYKDSAVLIHVHDYKLVNSKSATCVSDGYLEYYCSNCKGTYQNKIDATGDHNYKVAGSKNATCTTAGYKDYKCADCSSSYRKDISATGNHNYKVADSKNATCTAAGYKEYKCSACSKSYRDEIKATGHNYLDATCTAPKKCKTCGVTSGSALGHTDSAKCTRCGVTLFKTLTYSGAGSKTIDYSIPDGKFKATLTKTSGGGTVIVTVHYTTSSNFDTWTSLWASDVGDSEVEYITGSASSGSIVIDASSSHYGDSGWKITIEAVE